VYDFNAAQVVDALSKASNINAAVKSYLKRQASSQGAEAARFAKTLREVLQSGNSERATSFIAKHLEVQRGALLSVGACAHAEVIESVTAKVIEKYADDFNMTYELDGEEIKVTKPKEFEKISQQAIAMIDAHLKEQDLAGSSFVKAIAVSALFDGKVLKELDRCGLLS